MVNKKTWEEFRKSGMLWWINMILHTFGWAIVIQLAESGEIEEVYPARVKFRGFESSINDNGYISVTKFLKENIEDLEKELD